MRSSDWNRAQPWCCGGNHVCANSSRRGRPFRCQVIRRVASEVAQHARHLELLFARKGTGNFSDALRMFRKDAVHHLLALRCQGGITCTPIFSAEPPFDEATLLEPINE